MDDNDKIYYTLDKKTRNMAVKNGLVKYFRTLKAAKSSRFAGKKPYVIDYIYLDKYKEDAIIVPFPELDKVRNNAFYSEILQRCKVIIVTK
ncbi:hypothetical protein ACFL2A_05265 [Thermodesulfobacteriota bacterium]